jgi:hypothetical protein
VDENPLAVRVARLHYGGGGDWYEDRTSLANLLRAVRERLGVPVSGTKEAVVEPGSAALFQYPFLFACGHGNLKLSPTEAANLRRYLTTGGFLWVDDNYGLDASFRRTMERLFPAEPLVLVPADHPIYHSFYALDGVPKIHLHDGKPPQGWGLFLDGRLAVFYTYESDIGDGLEDAEVHKDPPEKREQALRMAINILMYALTH